ncbi:polysaccharide biosynthesis protein [Dellaglioa algida]|uniref:polysaccharide biosynthesis protein n=1 Tax=Dellaglioa algida TaxID=105612 RepID=UPI0024C4B482|nr:nucleoside-diphosphate sugar epimerase/dehydratase [Dellaglioa algida]MDK1724765.1 polysaccharide biosynthesis protein [Dellaglioa algida]MDK1738695.1 polysaccharide biosynthesis protein [Dellaglioa algida]
MKLFSKINRYTSFKEMIAIFIATTIAGVIANICYFAMSSRYSLRFGILTYLFVLLFICGSRFAWRYLVENILNNGETQPKIATLIVGAGDGSEVLMERIQRDNIDLNVIGYVDNDSQKQKMWMMGKQVLGTFRDIPKVVEEYGVQQVSIAIPSLEPKSYENLLDILNPLKVKVNRMSSFEDMLEDNSDSRKMHDIDVVDLLGRQEIKLDMAKIESKISGKTILVTGAGGSIGSEICRQVSKFGPEKLVLLGHGENSIYLIHQELKNLYAGKIEIIPIIADVQDRNHIFDLMAQYKPDLVYHAAAHKHVPLMEANPTEAIKNNVYGTKNVAEAAKAANVKAFVMISTDKAVNPPNIMGATKRLAEMIVTSLNEAGHTKFAVVRFGNVLGSRGSVVPLFKKQIAKGGPVTVTDLRMTRFFMTIPEASRLVIQAGTLSKGGELFILDMGKPVKIVDLARKMIKLSGYKENEIDIVESGMRPGEKLYEELLVSSEKQQEQVYEKIFLGKVTPYKIDDIMGFVKSVEPLTGSDLKKEVISYAHTHNGEPSVDSEGIK